MLALGIDPGTAICGYGFVEARGSRLIAHEYGAITTSPKAPMQDRLMKIYIFRVALNYGMITINGWDKRFYFEKEESNIFPNYDYYDNYKFRIIISFHRIFKFRVRRRKD